MTNHRNNPRSIVTLAAGSAGKFAAVRAAADKREAALNALDGAAEPDVPLALDEANAALQELTAALGLYKVGPEAMSISVPTSRGALTISLNQVREALRAKVKPSAVAESMAQRGWKPRARVA